jgi:phage tail sheath protein FI
MPVALSYPGVYVEEISSGVHTITGVATSITAFVGRALRGPANEPVRVQSFAEFGRVFGGLSLDCPLSYSVQQFFQNGGSDALIVRVYRKPDPVPAGVSGDGVATLVLPSGEVAAQGTLTIAANPSDGDTMTIDSKMYTFDETAAIAAEGTLTVADIPSDGDTITIDTKKYTFQSNLTDIDGNIAIVGGDLPATQANIVAAINLTGAAGTQYAQSTTVHPTVTAAAAFVNDKLVLTAKTAGGGGNNIATNATSAAGGSVFDAATLGTTRAGADAGLADIDGRIAIGADLATTQANIAAALNRSGTPGTQYAASMTAHPSVIAAPDFAGNNLVLTAKTPGVAGNNIATEETFAAAGNAFDAATLGTTRQGRDSTPAPGPRLAAASPGAWANDLRIRVNHQTRDPSDTSTFNFEVRQINPALPTTAAPIRSETFLNVSVDPASPLFLDKVLANRSALVRVGATSPNRPDVITDRPLAGGSDGSSIGDNDVAAAGLEGTKQGLWALEKADLFNLLCIPPFKRDSDIGALTRTAAEQYCRRRRAMFVVDPLADWGGPSDITDATKGVDGASFGLARSSYAALFFPQIRSPDPLRDGQLETFAPCGAVAGIMARTDAARGVWKAPAGIEATLSGVSELAVKLTDAENGQLNPLGINCLRAFPVIGRVVWGSRTLRGADQLASEWKYIPVRRTALFLEESLYRGTQWVVFEPNDEPLWAQIRLNIGGFMHNLFRQGAFQGKTPREAYFVKCDKDTTTQNDIDLGIVNIVVGFAPLKPAEFVVIQITQIAGQIET